MKKRRGWMMGMLAGGALGWWWVRQQQATGEIPAVMRPSDDPAQWALVTGASSGIGAIYARHLAREGYHVILVARREQRLQALAESLHNTYGVQAEVLKADLSTDEGLESVATRIKALDTLAVLVNNAGFGLLGNFASHPLADEEALLRVNVWAPVQLTHAALPGMIARGGGAIINVSSLMAFYPLGAATTYSAAKIYLLSFTEALQQEVASSGVILQALCPGYTRTEFTQHAELDMAWMPEWMGMTAEAVVEASWRDVQRGHVVSLPGLGNRLIAMLAPWVPRPLLYALGRAFSNVRQTHPSLDPYGFRKRAYESLDMLWADIRRMVTQRDRMHTLKSLDPAFMERLMLTVTQVNGCRYCASFHAGEALEKGVSQEQIDAILGGCLDECPPEEHVALLYAQHFAESQRQPEPEARARVIEAYGPEKAEAIDVALE